ncbi:CsbD family protein [Silvibacterium sp.]|uniref:CsbD family protein n=1 Tax=Silvibacterium sp. TaxID=1964179 RepID=UPI0039E2AC54
MNKDQVKGALQKAGGHVEEAAGALVGDAALKSAGQEDQIKGDAREAWGNLQEAGDGLIDRARVAKADAEIKAARAKAWDREHEVKVELPADEKTPEAKSPEKPGEDQSAEQSQGEKKNVA